MSVCVSCVCVCMYVRVCVYVCVQAVVGVRPCSSNSCKHTSHIHIVSMPNSKALSPCAQQKAAGVASLIPNHALAQLYETAFVNAYLIIPK